jgi:hypothetical protein
MSSRRGKGPSVRGAPAGNADRAQGLGHRLRNSQAQTLPHRLVEARRYRIR